MRRALVILVAIVVVAIVIVALAPATLASVALERASSGTLTLADAEGTLWRGRGMLVAARAVRLPVAWTIDPWPLVRSELRVRVIPPTASGASPHAMISARRDAITISGLDVTIPADVLGALAPRSGIRLSGDIRLTTPLLDWSPTAFVGSARADWQDARFAFRDDAGIRLGNASATLTAAGDRLTGPVRNEGGEFEVRGTLTVAASGAPELSLVMAPRGGDSAQMRTLVISGSVGSAGWNVEFRPGPR